LSRGKLRIGCLSQKGQEVIHLYTHKGKATGKRELKGKLWKAVPPSNLTVVT
jgi:hypothetical protein